MVRRSYGIALIVLATGALALATVHIVNAPVPAAAPVGPAPNVAVATTTAPSATRDIPAEPAAAPDASTATSQAVRPIGAGTAPDPIGVVQGVPTDLNPQVASVTSALAQHDHPERLNALIQPPPFDAQAFAADPQRYANEVVPGRVFQSAPPGPGVPVLQPVVPTRVTIAQDQETILRVRSVPGAAVTFSSFDLGRFSNHLVSQTVIADSAGIGSVSFTAGPGTVDAVHVLAGSPNASGQVAFDIMVMPKG